MDHVLDLGAGKVDGNGRLRRDGAGHGDVQARFAVRLAGVFSSVDGNVDEVRHG